LLLQSTPWQNHSAERSPHVDELLHVQLNLLSDQHPLKVGSLTKIEGMNSFKFGKTKHSSLPNTSLLENSQLQVLFPALFNFQGIRPFVEMHGNYYLDLVRVFYYNLKIRDEVALSKVKGVDIIIDNDIWENVAKFPINDAAESILNGIDGFNQILAYQSFLRNPAQDVGRQLLAGGLKMDERLIHYLIVWILCPRGTNHAQCSEADLLIMYTILNRVSIKWSSLILDTMLKAKRYPQYPLPYSLLISRICEYKGIDTTGELCQSTLRANEIAESSLKQLKLVPLGDTFVHRDDMPNYDAEDEELPPIDPIPPATQNVGSSSAAGSSFSIEDNIANMNKRLEELFLLSN